MSYETIKHIPKQPLAIIGDIHGESDALENLLKHLQDSTYNNRKIVFIGDLCDRGPKSLTVINTVQDLINNNKAYAILGNHEINLLANDAKDGSGWYFNSRIESDSQFYAPFEIANPAEKESIHNFLNQLPIAVCTPEIRMIHAAWDSNAVNRLKSLSVSSAHDIIKHYHNLIKNKALENNLLKRYQLQKQEWLTKLEDPEQQPPFLQDIAEFESLEHRFSAIKRVTSGIEHPCTTPFFSGNRWRFSDRTPWWNSYAEPTPVVIGHYWRLFKQPNSAKNWRYSALFKDISPFAWHGKQHNVFCVDYSVGARWRERKQHIDAKNSKFKLAALLWPERKLIFDDGLILNTD